MKHDIKINLIILSLFLFSQIIGLAVVNSYIDVQSTKETGNVTYSDLPLNMETPQEESNSSFIVLIIGLLIATVLAFLLLKFKVFGVWKIWFGLAVFMAMTISLNTILPEIIAIIIALLLALWKIFRPNFIVHNLTEIMIYGGIAAIFVPMLNLFAVIVLLVLISIYDIIAVNKSKHMVKLANMQKEAKTFAGFNIPYIVKGSKTSLIKFSAKPGNAKNKVKLKSAILGGGDIVFPLIFAGVILKTSLLVYSPFLAVARALVIVIFSSAALLFLFMTAKKDKFYPAMPYISAGCFLGYAFLWILF